MLNVDIESYEVVLRLLKKLILLKLAILAILLKYNIKL